MSQINSSIWKSFLVRSLVSTAIEDKTFSGFWCKAFCKIVMKAFFDNTHIGERHFHDSVETMASKTDNKPETKKRQKQLHQNKQTEHPNATDRIDIQQERRHETRS